MDFWRENVDRILESNDRKVLIGKGSVSNVLMEKKVKEIHDEFYARRKGFEALQEDKSDMEELRRMEEKLKKNK